MRKVLFTERVEVVPDYGERRDCADQRIAAFIDRCGFLPVPVPNVSGIPAALIAGLQPAGIVLTGGNSLVKYGGNAPERDETDRELLALAVQEKLPVYGFCRGMQSILDFFDCVLVEAEGHVAVRHVITGEESARTVNSYHRQACLRLSSDELIAVMKADDGVIEAVRHRKLPIVGTMWHPEREEPFAMEDIRSVKDLFKGGE